MAEAVPADAFLAWAAEAGIGFDPRYAGANSLGLLPGGESSRFWELPGHPYSAPYLVRAVLDGLDRWDFGYLWPREGRWPAAGATPLPSEQVRDVVLRGAGMPDGWAGAARVSRSEQLAVVAALFAALALGGDATSDLYFVPDHGRQVVQAGHHDVIHVECADEARVLAFVAHMQAAGFPLPTEPPDATFRWPHWMAQRHAEPGAVADGGA